MTQNDRYTILQAELRDFGRGYTYDVYRWDESAYEYEFLGSVTRAKKKLRDHDKVKVRVYTAGRTQYSVTTREFTLTPKALGPAKKWKEAKKKFRSQWKRPRDSQRQRLYDFESDYMRQKEPISIEEARQLAAEVYADFGLTDVPKIESGDGRRYRTSTYYPSRHKIVLAQGWGHTRTVVLHELAHALIKSFGLSRNVASHGPEFAGLLIDLYALYGPKRLHELLDGVPTEDWLAAQATRVGIKFAPNITEHLIKENGDK